MNRDITTAFEKLLRLQGMTGSVDDWEVTLIEAGTLVDGVHTPLTLDERGFKKWIMRVDNFKDMCGLKVELQLPYIRQGGI